MGAVNDTIAAISSPPGKGGIGIVRISGPDAENLAGQMLGLVPEPRFATNVTIRNQDGDEDHRYQHFGKRKGRMLSVFFFVNRIHHGLIFHMSRLEQFVPTRHCSLFLIVPVQFPYVKARGIRI